MSGAGRGARAAGGAAGRTVSGSAAVPQAAHGLRDERAGAEVVARDDERRRLLRELEVGDDRDVGERRVDVHQRRRQRRVEEVELEAVGEVQLARRRPVGAEDEEAEGRDAGRRRQRERAFAHELVKLDLAGHRRALGADAPEAHHVGVAHVERRGGAVRVEDRVEVDPREVDRAVAVLAPFGAHVEAVWALEPIDAERGDLQQRAGFDDGALRVEPGLEGDDLRWITAHLVERCWSRPTAGGGASSRQAQAKAHCFGLGSAKTPDARELRKWWESRCPSVRRRAGGGLARAGGAARASAALTAVRTTR